MLSASSTFVRPVRTYDEVHSDKLLETLKNNTGDGTLTQVSLEAFDVGSLAERFLVLPVTLDLFELADKTWVVGR